VVQKHERLGAKLRKELRRSRPGLTVIVSSELLIAEDVGITAYTLTRSRQSRCSESGDN
jgi:hypothetical protein